MKKSDVLVYTVEEAGEKLGLSRGAAYDAAKRGDLPIVKIGKLIRVPKAPFDRLLGSEERVEKPVVSQKPASITVSVHAPDVRGLRAALHKLLDELGDG